MSRSRGETTVRETAPATPPAQNAATTGWAIVSRSRITVGPYLGMRLSLSDCIAFRLAWGSKKLLGGTNSRHFCVYCKPSTPKLEAQRVFRPRAYGQIATVLSKDQTMIALAQYPKSIGKLKFENSIGSVSAAAELDEELVEVEAQAASPRELTKGSEGLGGINLGSIQVASRIYF